MSEIRVKEGESLESALRRFKRSTARSGVLAEVRKREAYEKPSVRRKKKSEAARKRKFKYSGAIAAAMPPFSITVFTQRNGRTGSQRCGPVLSLYLKTGVALARCPALIIR